MDCDDVGDGGGGDGGSGDGGDDAGDGGSDDHCGDHGGVHVKLMQTCKKVDTRVSEERMTTRA